jgi:hypothetical protein
VLVELSQSGGLPTKQVAEWVAELDIVPEAPFALAR